MIDLHTHILPGVDDGAASRDETLRMLRLAHQSGTRTIVATPHMYHPAFAKRQPAEIRQRFEALREHLNRMALESENAFLRDLQVLLGAENHWGADFMEALAGGTFLRIDGGPCVLVEFRPALSPAQLTRACRILRAEGLFPLLAHVERYTAVRRRPELLRELLDEGCLTQLNARTLEGSPWNANRRLGFRLLRAGLISAIASDAHDPEKRSPFVAPLLDRLRQEFSEGRIREWTVDCPARTIRGGPI